MTYDIKASLNGQTVRRVAYGDLQAWRRLASDYTDTLQRDHGEAGAINADLLALMPFINKLSYCVCKTGQCGVLYKYILLLYFFIRNLLMVFSGIWTNAPAYAGVFLLFRFLCLPQNAEKGGHYGFFSRFFINKCRTQHSICIVRSRNYFK